MAAAAAIGGAPAEEGVAPERVKLAANSDGEGERSRSESLERERAILPTQALGPTGGEVAGEE